MVSLHRGSPWGERLAPPRVCSMDACAWTGRTFARECPLCGGAFFPSAVNFNFRRSHRQQSMPSNPAHSTFSVDGPAENDPDSDTTNSDGGSNSSSRSAPPNPNNIVLEQQGIDLGRQEVQTLKACPPSQKFVFYVLVDQGPLSVPELKERTALPERTARRAATELCEADLVSSRPDTNDPSLTVYAVDR